MKKRKSARWMAAMLALMLLVGTLGGCGKDAGGSDGGVPVEKIGESRENSAAPEADKGRYVEIQEALPGAEELEGQEIVQMYKVDGKIRFLTKKQEGGTFRFREWEKQEGGYADVTKGWLSSLELKCGDWVEAQLMQGQGERQYLYAGYVAEGEEGYKGHLWKGEGDTAEEITPEKWAVPDEEFGGYEMIIGLVALDNGTLVSISYTSRDILSGEDGSVQESEPLSAYYEGRPVTDGENVYLFSGEANGGQIERQKDGKGEVEVIPYPTTGNMASGGSDGIVLNMGGAGRLALDILEDGTLIAAGEKGIFRLEGGEADGQWEQLVAGMETDFAMTDYSCMDFVALEDGSIYALFMAEEEMKLNRYEYDPNAVSEVKETLKLYTVFEDSLLKRAAILYHKAHPEVLIDIQYAYPMYYYDIPDYDAVYQELNTMLMGDGAPDIVAMDHLNVSSYAEKGLLADLDDVVRPLEESGELVSNITGSYVREDGKRYVVPLQFAVNMALGRDITAADMGTMEALAGFLSQAGESYFGNQTVAELVDKFYPYFCDEIVDGKQLDKEALGRYLEYLKAIGDNCGIIAARKENEIEYGMWELGGEAKLAFAECTGFVDCMFPMSMVDYIKGDFTAFENRFRPSMLMGVCSKSQYSDTAKDFLRFALSQEVQDTDSYTGFPVNKASMEKQAEKDRSDFMASTMIKGDDGSYLEFNSEAYPPETAQKLVAMCEGLDKPVGEDAKIREVLIENLGGYLDGSQSKEATVQKIEDGLKMYLAE